jgi:hypothetical protein
MTGMRPARLMLVAGLILVLAGSGCSWKSHSTVKAECSAILTVGATTYWGVQVNMPTGTHTNGHGEISACSDGVRPHHHTGTYVTTYLVPGFDASQALISPAGPGDPTTLWIPTSGSEPPFTSPPGLQALIDHHAIPGRMQTSVN